MRWFDSDFDYVQEMIDSWNKRRRKVRISCFIIATLLIIAGILTVVFPIRIFALIQYVAAAAMIIMGIYHLVSYGSMTYYFRDPQHTGRYHAPVYARGADCRSDHIYAGVPAALQRSAEAVLRLKAPVFPDAAHRIPDSGRSSGYHTGSDLSSSAVYNSAGHELHYRCLSSAGRCRSPDRSGFYETLTKQLHIIDHRQGGAVPLFSMTDFPKCNYMFLHLSVGKLHIYW